MDTPLLTLPDLQPQRDLPLMGQLWTHEEAVHLCRLIESVAPNFGCHTALTGGTLQKDGARKDVDILIYRRRECFEINWDGLRAATSALGITWGTDYGWCKKATFNGKRIDFFDSEELDGDDHPSAQET